jgi:hypothetical protein
MADGNTITRRDICKKYDFSIATLRNIIVFNKELNFPEPIGYEGQSMIYNTKAIDDWFAANPLKGTKLNNQYVSKANAVPTPSKPGFQNASALSFLSSRYDNKDRQLKRAARIIDARQATERYRVTVTTQEIGFIPATNHWEGLI